MTTKNTSETQKVLIASDYLSYEELEVTLKNIDIKTELISREEKVRNDIHPVLLVASSLYITKDFIIPMVKLIINQFKEEKPKGLIIIEFPSIRVKLRFDLSMEDFNKKVDKLKGLLGNPKLFITQDDDDE
ncbi:hypothetical protein IMCC3317_17740 [Kordia antarctica]|uniref:Uncharacterized protein n=1 Tax=Kordia antarctica TaxID=1218801 RepID=A0A7L4ZIS7_9FLAO|nr:hypothetical protein [Kordia antarctica]QHI36411.1 hypothetical protein IMCC3317_17740 [Kordia antarctica]